MRHNILAILLVVLLLLPASASANERSLNLCMWAEAFPNWVFDQFQHETGIKVYSSFYASEDIMLQRVSENPGHFDLVECSPSYVFQQLMENSLVASIERDKFPYWDMLNPNIRTTGLDPDMRYMLPYVWGSLLIAVNPQLLDPALITGFGDLWGQQVNGSLLLPDELRSVFSFTLLTMGLSPNDNNLQNWQQAMLKLEKLINRNTIIATNSMEPLLNGRVMAAVSWNGAVLEAVRENPDLRVIEPSEGAILWFDGFFIPAKARNVEEAYAFLRFIFRPDICARVTQDTLYATTNEEARQLLPKHISSNLLIYPSNDAMKRAIMEEPLPGLMREEQQIWSRLRATIE